MVTNSWYRKYEKSPPKLRRAMHRSAKTQARSLVVLAVPKTYKPTTKLPTFINRFFGKNKQHASRVETLGRSGLLLLFFLPVLTFARPIRCKTEPHPRGVKFFIFDFFKKFLTQPNPLISGPQIRKICFCRLNVQTKGVGPSFDTARATSTDTRNTTDLVDHRWVMYVREVIRHGLDEVSNFQGIVIVGHQLRDFGTIFGGRCHL
jgi:hypothetical protein